MFDRNTIEVKNAKDVGVFSTRVYGWMAAGLAFTAFVALFIVQTGLFVKLAPLWWVWGFATFGVALAIQRSIQRSSVGTVVGLFLLYSGLEGILFGTVLPVFAYAYGGQLVWAAFGGASVIFALSMAYGLMTRADLTSMGRILSMGLIGLIVLSLIGLVLSFFMPITFLHILISWLGLFIFVGLTAYDAQTIRMMSQQADVHSALSYKLSMVMALRMYINVIMIFWYLLQIFASSSDRR